MLSFSCVPQRWTALVLNHKCLKSSCLKSRGNISLLYPTWKLIPSLVIPPRSRVWPQHFGQTALLVYFVWHTVRENLSPEALRHYSPPSTSHGAFPCSLAQSFSERHHSKLSNTAGNELLVFPIKLLTVWLLLSQFPRCTLAITCKFLSWNERTKLN